VIWHNIILTLDSSNFELGQGQSSMSQEENKRSAAAANLLRPTVAGKQTWIGGDCK